MAWARIDDGFHDHPKVDELSLSAVGLWTLCLTWAHRHRRTALIPGHITEARVRKIAARQTDALTAELVAARLWDIEPNIGGWVIHDFADYLPKQRDSAEAAEAGKRGAAKRWQSRSIANSHDRASSEVAEPIAVDGSRASAPASPSRPVPSKEQTAGPRKRGTRLQDNWRPTSEDVAWQRAKGISDLDARRELEKFSLYWQAKSGRDAAKTDWSKTWRGWLLRSAEHAPNRPAQPPEQRRLGDFSHLRASTDW